MSDHRIRQVMRAMAWERAKGELKSMLQTHVGEMEQHQSLTKAIEDFITEVEDNGRHE